MNVAVILEADTAEEEGKTNERWYCRLADLPHVIVGCMFKPVAFIYMRVNMAERRAEAH